MCDYNESVWLVICGIEHEGETTVGAFRNERVARAIAKKHNETDRGDKMYDYCRVECFDIGLMNEDIFC